MSLAAGGKGHAYGDLPDVVLGTDPRAADVMVTAAVRKNGILIVGRSGAGKSLLLDNITINDINALDERGSPACGVLYIDTHDGARNILPRIRPERRKDVRILSLFPDDVPFFPLFSDARDSDGINNLAAMLTDAWKVQYGEDAVGARAEDILTYGLHTAPKINLTPLELMATFTLRAYRDKFVKKAVETNEGWGLHMYWKGPISVVKEDGYINWAESVRNKLSPLVIDEWLRLATCGLPPLVEGDTVGLDCLDAPDLLSVMLVSDGLLMITRDSVRYEEGDVDGPRPQFIRFADEFDDYLLDLARTNADGRGIIHSRAFRDGLEVDHPEEFEDDVHEPGLRPPTAEERARYGPTLVEYVARRRRRRAWHRYSQLVLGRRPPYRRLDGNIQPIQIRETFSIPDMLDDKKVVILEIPEFRGPRTTRIIATFALIQARMRGHRQLGLPQDRIVPVSVCADEASLYMSSTLEATLAQLRKAKVALTLAVQRLGQLGMVNPHLRRGITDTVGTLIYMAPGGREDDDMEREVHVDDDVLRKLGTGEGYVVTLATDTRDDGTVHTNVRTEAIHCSFHDLPKIDDDGSLAMLRNSVERMYQPRTEALASWLRRAALAQRTMHADEVDPDRVQPRAPRRKIYADDDGGGQVPPPGGRPPGLRPARGHDDF